MQNFKRFMAARGKDISNDELVRRLQQFFLKYPVTPHSTTNRTLTKLLLGRKAKTLFDRIRTDMKDIVNKRDDVAYQEARD